MNQIGAGSRGERNGRRVGRLWIVTLIISLVLLILPVTGGIMIVPPEVTIEPPEIHSVGDTITLSGTTNLAPGNELLVEIISQSFGPTPKEGDSAFSGVSGVTMVQKGSGDENTWSFTFDTATFIPDTYLVTISGLTVTDAVATTRFSLAEVTPPPTVSPTTFPTTMPTTEPTALPPTTTGLSGLLVIGAVMLVVIILGTAGRRG